MWHLVVVFAIVKDSKLHQLLEHQGGVVEIGVKDMPKYLLNIWDELVNVTWCLGMLEVLNRFE